MEDKLQLFYNSLSANPNIKGIPDDYDVFRSTLADPEKSELFYNSLSANPKIKGLPEDYDAFVSGLNLNTGGVTPKEEQQQQRQGYFEGLGNKLQAGALSLGEIVTEIPQFAEGVSNLPYMIFSNMMVNRAEKKGEIDKETADVLKKEQLLPKSSFAQGLPRMPGEQTVGEALANSKLNQFFEDKAEELSEAATRYDRTATEYIKDKQFGKALGVVSYGIAESLAPTLAAAFSPYGAAYLGLGVGAQSYDEVKDREDMSEMMKLADAVTSGIFEWVFERFGTREMAQFLKGYYKQAGKKGIEQAIKSQGLQNLFARAYKKFGLWFAPLHEGLSEMLTEFGQNWAAKFSGEDPNRKITDNAIESFLVGTGMGGVFTSTAALAKKLKGQEDETGTPGEPVDQGPPGIGELKVPYTEEQATEAINEIGKDLKFGDTPLEEDPNPIISFAETKLGQKVILKKEGGVNGDTFFIAFDLETNEPILVKPRDILERKDVPYQEWVKNELNNYNIVKTQGGKMVAQAEAPVQEGQEITLKDKNFYVSEVTPEGIALNEIDEEGNVTGATVHITPDQYGPVFGIEEQPGEAPTIKEGATGQPVTEDAQTAPQEELQIPLNKQGEIDYDNIQDPQTYAQALIQEFAEGAPTVLDELITEKQDALAKAGKVSNAIERARKIKSLNSEINKLTDVRNILSPTATTTTIASPAVEQAEPIEQPTAQDMARTKEEQPVVEQTTAQTPSTPDETVPVEAEMQKAGEVEKKTSADLTKANAEIDTNPTEAQKEAGNYKKGHLSVQGLDISIENPAMSVRSGTDKAGKKWSVMLNNSYGYFRRTKGKDGDQVDVFLGDNLDSDAVYVIDQVNPETGLFDEHKVMMGFISAQDAKDNYLANYEPGWKGLGAISKMSIDQFKDWLGSGTRTKKPVDGNVPVKKKAEPKTKAEKPSKPVKEVTLKPRKKGFTYGPNSRTGKVLSKTPNSFQEAVLQFFIGGGRIKTQDFLDHTGYKRGSREFRQYVWAIKNDGQRLDTFNEALDNSFGIEDQGPMDMINEVIDILRTYPGRGHMMTALEKMQDVETIPDHMLPPEEDPSLEYDDLQGADEETEELTDDIMDHPEVKEIIKEYSFDGVLDVSKLLDKIDTDPNEFTIFPFALKKSELLKLKERLQDEQRRRTQESQTGTGQHNKDQSQGARENTTRSDQGNAVRTGPVEKGPAEKPEVTRKSSQKSKSEFAGEVLEKKSPKGKAEYGSKNKVFTADAAQKARELLKKKLGNLNVGIDPEVMQAGITLAGYHIEAGARKFADYAKEMINDMGEAIKPYLKSFYNAVRDWPGFDTEGMDDYAAVSTIDVSNLVAENLDNTKEVSNLHKNIQDVPNRSGDSQPNSQNNSDEVSGDEETVPNEGGSSRPVGDESSQQNRETRGGRSSQGGSGLFAPLFGEPSNNKVSQEDQSPELTDDDAGDFDGRGNDLFGPAGPEAPESANSISTDSPTATEPAQEGDVAKLIIQKHSKTGAELPTVQLLNRVSSDVYNKYKSIASSFGGRWSSYKREGMIPGFIFRNGEDAKNALTQINNTKNDVSSLHDKAEKYIKKNKVYSQARPKTDFPEEVSFVSEGSLGNIPGQLNLFGEEVYSPTPPDDNVTYVERLLSDKGQIEFIGDKITGPSEIRSSADIAFLFKNLESAASENVFFVFIDKNNKYKVLYMSTGTTNMAPVDTKIVVAAAKEFKAERAVFVHNHPSGSLKASDSDIKTYSRTRDLLEKIGVTLDPSVIINLDSGEYAVFDTSSFSVVPSDKMYYDLYETVTPQSIYQFDRQKLYAPLSDHHAIRESSDVAEYLSRMKRGTTPKIHAIILDRNLKITRYALYDETITREKLIEELLYEVGKHGENIILASNSDPAPELLSSISNAMKLANGQLLDYVVIKQSDDITRNYNSYADLGYLSEPDIEYGEGPDAKFRISDDLYFSPVERALDAIKQDKATVEQFKAMLLKNGAKQAELDWMGWDEFANDKRVITKAKIQDWIDQNKIRVEEVQKGGFQWKGNDLIVGGKVVANLIHNEDGTWSYQSDFSEGEEAWETKLDAQKEAEEAIIGDAYSPNATKYSQYTLPGGENYKELLLTMPDLQRKNRLDYNRRFGELEKEVLQRLGDNIKYPAAFNLYDAKHNGLLTPDELSRLNSIDQQANKKLPENFKSSHFEEPNILAHVRFNTRRTQDGKNILFIEEIQSDWAQEGKKKGYKSDKDKLFKDLAAKGIFQDRKSTIETSFIDKEGNQIYHPNSNVPQKASPEQDAAIDEFYKEYQNISNASIPDMPYKKTDQWVGLALRRMVRYAIDNGFDAIAWTPGEVQNERYDLSKQVDKITYNINEKTRKTEYPFKMRVWPKNGGSPIVREINNVNELENFLGKEIAEKIDSSGGEYEGRNRGYKILSNLDLKVGGSGMTGFYDNILPSIANKLGKKFGSQVTSENIATGEIPVSPEEASISNQSKDTYTSVHSLPITDAMFESYRQGIPLFRRNQYQGQSLLFDVVGINTSQNLEKEIRDKVKDLEESLNTKITIIQNRGQLPERIQRQAIRQGIATNKRITGVYDPQTESVYVLLDDVKAVGIIKGIEEVIKTVLHEVVAHKGLPSLLGQDEYNRLLDSVYWDMPQIDRSFLMEQYNTTDPHTIADEYLAMMAEQNVSPTLFQRILAKIRQLLRKLFKINYSENDIHDMLRRSRENLHKPQANNYTNAEEYLEAIDTYEKARFRVAKAYSKNIVDKAAEAYKEKEVKRSIKETKQGIREYIQDLNLPVRKFEEEVLKRGGKQDDQSKPYRDTSLSFGRQEKLYNDFFDQKMKPVLNTVAKMKKTGIPGENILPYIIAKHAIERNRVFRTKERDEYIASNPEATPSEIKEIEEVLKDKDYSGVMPFDKEGEYTNPDELAQDIVNEFETQLNNKGLIDELWENLRTANTSILDTWVKGDQISEEQREEYLNNFKYFVPLRGWRQGAAKELIYTKGQGFSRSLRHAEGRKTLADNPLAYILSVQFQAISEQVTNEVNNSMLNLIIKNLGNNEIHELATLKKLYYLKVNLPDGSYEWEPTLTRPTAEQFASGEARTKIFREHEKLRAPSQAREHEVIVRKPGGDMVMIFKGQNLPVAQSLNKQNYLYRSIFGNVHDARDINKAMTLLGDINNILKAAYTSWNVVFPFTNFMRDFQEASITQAIKQGSGLKVIRNYKHAFPAIIRHLTGKADLNNRIDKELEEFYQYGGATGYTHLKTPEEIEKDIKKEIKRMVRAGSLRGDMANTAVKFLGGVEAWNMIFEDATRFSVYLASIASGNTKKDAAYDAKEASVNFNRKGKGSKAWDAYFAFFNVAIQSMQKNFALAKDHTGKFAAVAGSFIAVGFLEAMMNALFDDDDDTSYYNINPYMRQNYLVIPNIISLLRGGTKGDKYLSIPLPQFWRGFKSMGAIGFDIAVKKATVKDGIMQALGNFGASLLPVDIGGFWASGEFSFAPIMPTVIKPVVEVLENTNYMGYAIKNEPFTRDQEAILANAGLGKKNVSPAAKFITDMLFRWGGGDSKYKYYYDSNKGISKKVPGILDINPSTIEHLFKGYTGGTGGVFSDMITTISQALDVEQEIDYRNMPFVNRFIRKVPESKWDIISKYYNLRDDNKVINALSSNYFKEGQYEKALEIAGDEYMAKYVAIFKHYESALNDAKKAVDFDDVEGNYVGIELMRQCVNDINDLKEEYGR